MEKYFCRGWYLFAFIAVMGFASGASLSGDYSYVKSALSAAGGMEGNRLIYIAAQSVMLNVMTALWSGLSGNGALSGLFCASGIWFKCVVVGLCCRGLVYGGGFAIAVLTIAGGCLICLSLLMKQPAGREERRLRMSLWTAGTVTEAVFIPSLAKTLSLLSA